MDMYQLQDFFMWCTIINAALLIVSTGASTLAFDSLYRVHSKCYPISKDNVALIMYALLGLYKTIVIVFNVVPYIALTIML